MAKKSMIAKAAREQRYKVREYTRCNRCGRPRAVYRKFGLCRICLRELAHEGVIPGMTKSSWEGERDADRSSCRHARPPEEREQGAARDRRDAGLEHEDGDCAPA